MVFHMWYCVMPAWVQQCSCRWHGALMLERQQMHYDDSLYGVVCMPGVIMNGSNLYIAYKFFSKWDVDITTFTWIHEAQFSANRDLPLESGSHVGIEFGGVFRQSGLPGCGSTTLTHHLFPVTIILTSLPFPVLIAPNSLPFITLILYMLSLLVAGYRWG